MKRYFLSFLLLLTIATAIGQAKKKPAAKEKPPTQKEMDEMMKEMQKAMDEMSPDEKKMMDSMGVKMPDMKSLPKFSDKELAAAWEEEARVVPKKNLAAIAAIPATPTTAALPSYISNVHKAVGLKLPAAIKADGENLYTQIKQQPDMTVASAAIGFWLNGQPALATFLMGKACQDEPQNVHHLNNYAAMLTMNGAQHAAIPILQNLNKRYPNNSTVLNNIGQAWFGLGDIDKAGRYLDSAIRIYAYHSQANYTKSHIEESKGNTTGAVEAMIRSVKKAHSADKESRLRKLGKKLSGKDVDFPFPMPQDPLGLEKFSWPEYPMGVRASDSLEPAWALFRKNCDDALSELNAQAAILENKMTEAIQKRATALMRATSSGQPIQAMPKYAQVAALKLNYLAEDKDGGIEHQIVKSYEQVSEALLKDAELQEAKSAAEKILDEKYEPLIGEGRPNPLNAYCSDVNAVRNKYLKETNTQLQMKQKAAFELQRKWLNNQVYYAQYINWPEEFEVIKIHAKIKWLNMIKGQIVRFQPMGPHCTVEEEKKPSKKTLQEFDDVACKYHSSVTIGIMEFNSDCRYLTGKLNLGKLTYTRKINSDDHNRLVAASLEIKLGAGMGWEKGPVQAELKADISGRLEWNDKEITNWEVSSEVGVNAGSNLGYKDQSIDIAGVKATIGMNSSGRVQGSGLLQNLSLTGK
jgi:tetratricopeptide (TPR) repeat protein